MDFGAMARLYCRAQRLPAVGQLHRNEGQGLRLSAAARG